MLAGNSPLRGQIAIQAWAGHTAGVTRRASERGIIGSVFCKVDSPAFAAGNRGELITIVDVYIMILPMEVR
jgi:hypothetical protein